MTETYQEGTAAPARWDDLRVAAELVVSSQFGSTSMLQRKMRLNFSEATAVMNDLEDLGVVGPDNGSRAREVRIRHTDGLAPIFVRISVEELAESAGNVRTLPSVLHPTAPEATVLPPAPRQDAPASPPVDVTKPAAAVASAPVEGTVVSTGQRLPDDPEGDAPWINPSLRTKEGRRARADYLARQSRRRARRWVARQRTAHGVLPRAVRGQRRVRRWVIGMEGAKARADLALAHGSVDAARREARRASIAIRDRRARLATAKAAQMEASQAVIVAQSARSRARNIVLTRAAMAYGPVALVDGLMVVEAGGFWGLLAAAAANIVGASFLGRDVELTEDQLAALEAAEAGVPQRMEIGMTPKMFERMVKEALTESLKVSVAQIRVEPHEWGFMVFVWLDRMTPEKISSQLDLLEGCLSARTGSILLQQSAQARNECVIRFPGNDPWRFVPRLPYRAPHSLTTADLHKAQIGADMATKPLALPMSRTNINVVGKSRSGKSTILRAILDAVTATDDQIIIGIDLGSAGSGFGGLRSAMHAVITNPEDAQRALQWALDIGKGRPGLFDQLNMGQNWQTSRKRPAIKIIVDEFPALVRVSRKGYYDDEAKRNVLWELDTMLAELAITSLKSDVTMIIAGQGVTKEKIKDNTWLTELQVQVLAACDVDDVVQILGGGAMAQGWRPDRLLPAMADQVNDASVAYVMAGAQYCEPIPYRACIESDEELLRRGIERGQAGLVDIDAESAAFSSISLSSLMADSNVQVAAGAQSALIATIRQIFADAGDPAGLSREELADALEQADPGRWALEEFDGDDEVEQAETRVAAVRAAIDAVLAPTGQAWALEKYSKALPRGYRLRDLKTITGEDSPKP